MPEPAGPVAILLDFDGVILESAGIKTWGFRQLFGGSPRGQVDAIVAYHEAHEGVSRYEKFRVICREILREPCDDMRMAALDARFSTLVVDAVIRCPFVRGAEAFLDHFGCQYPLFVVSGTPQQELEEVVRRRGLRASIREIHGSPRSKPEIMRGILRRFGWRPEQVVAIGDSLTDAEAARAVGIPFIGRRRQDAPGVFAGADGIPTVDDLSELAQRWELVCSGTSDPAPHQDPQAAATRLGEGRRQAGEA